MKTHIGRFVNYNYYDIFLLQSFSPEIEQSIQHDIRKEKRPDTNLIIPVILLWTIHIT